MLRAARAKANLFTGAEDAEHLSDKQLTALLAFDKWPSKRSGSTFPSSPYGVCYACTFLCESIRRS